MPYFDWAEIQPCPSVSWWDLIGAIGYEIPASEVNSFALPLYASTEPSSPMRTVPGVSEVVKTWMYRLRAGRAYFGSVEKTASPLSVATFTAPRR